MSDDIKIRSLISELVKKGEDLSKYKFLVPKGFESNRYVAGFLYGIEAQQHTGDFKLVLK